MPLFTGHAGGSVPKIARAVQRVKDIVTNREKMLRAKVFCTEFRMLGFDHPDFDNTTIGQGDAVWKIGQVDFRALDQDAVRGRVEVVKAPDDRRMVLADIGELVGVLTVPTVGMMPLVTAGIVDLRDIEDEPVIPFGAKHVDLAGVGDRRFKDIITAETGKPGGGMSFHVRIAMVNEMVVL
ncbi:MAG: hypothetical protein Q7J57_11225 [Gemmobacter sp.]|nr:hypothetical protein [Gemmobacter sp.]